jgi:YidC/Oxa1 family membrane protein insertase
MLISANIFQPLIDVFQAVLKFFHDNVGVSWGWSIVLLTICVRLVLVPLAIKQLSSMRKMQHLQPQLKAVQNKYKDDKQRQQQEVMTFYRENEVNPLASCLPMVLQLPVFISLFYMLRQSLRKDICQNIQTNFQRHYAAIHHISLHAAAGQTTQCGDVPGAGFLFIKDITNQAHGVTLVVLLLLYVGTQVMSTMLMATPTMDKTQQRIMMLMPVVFVLFVIRFPAGLIVYWITTNTWTMGQQYTFKRLVGPPPAAVVADDGGGSGGSAAARKGRAPGGITLPTKSSEPAARAGIGTALRQRLNPAQNGKAASDEGDMGAAAGNGKPPVSRPSGARGTPPPAPRKRKKRSGRRR